MVVFKKRANHYEVLKGSDLTTLDEIGVLYTNGEDRGQFYPYGNDACHLSAEELTTIATFMKELKNEASS